MPSSDPPAATPPAQWNGTQVGNEHREEIGPPQGICLPQWIGRRAQRHGDRVAVTFIDDDRSEQSWTYGELWNRACSVAARLPNVDQPAPRGLLLFPPGIEFLAGFLGCQIAGWIPVPTCYPRASRALPRLDSAATDCSPSAIIGDRATIDSIDPKKLCDVARSLSLM